MPLIQRYVGPVRGFEISRDMVLVALAEGGIGELIGAQKKSLGMT